MSAKKFFTADKKQGPLTSNLNQVIDIIQEDVSGSATRRKYQTFVTGGIGPGVTSSLYQTVYDQDFTLQTANPVTDMTVGLFHYDEGTSDTRRQNLVTINSETGYTRFDNGQITFDTKHTMMMREKVNIYRQYAKLLLGDADKPFCLDGDGTNNKNTIDKNTDAGVNQWKDSSVIMDACMFVNVKRLFARDALRPETFAMRLYERAPQWNTQLYPEHTTGTSVWKPDFVPYYDTSTATYGASADATWNNQGYYRWDGTDRFNAMTNLFGGDVNSSIYGVQIIADIGGNPPQVTASESRWSYLKLASDTTKLVGLIFYDAGIAVLNLGTSTQASSVGWGTALTPKKNPQGYKYASDNSTGGDGGMGGHLSMRPVFAPYDRINGVLSGMSADFTDTAQKGWQGNNAQAAGQVFIGRVDGQTDANTVVLDAGGTSFADSLLKNEKTYDSGGPGVSGTISNLTTYSAGVEYQQTLSSGGNGPKINPNAQFYPDLLVSGSIDDIVDHIGFTRFSSGSLTSMAFQNSTKIQSSIFFCRASASQFNGSANGTWSEPNPNNPNGQQWLLTSTSDQNRPYTYITTVLLYDASDELVAVAKLNRPIEKNSESELTVRVRLDF